MVFLYNNIILEEAENPNSLEENSNKSEIVVSDESDSEIQVGYFVR